MNGTTWRVLAGALAVSSVLAAPPRVAAQGRATRACVDAADRGQRLRDEGQLLAAREAFAGCAAQACPGVVRRHCIEWIDDVEARIPSVLVQVRTESGADVVGATALLDDEPFDALDGTAHEIEPGPHTIEVRTEGGYREVQQLVAVERERDRLVRFVVPSASSPTPAAPGPPSDAAAVREPRRGVLAARRAGWVTLVLGAGAAAASVAPALRARDDANTLRRRCAPGCDASEVDDVDQRVRLANAAFGVGLGVAALGLTLVVWSAVHMPDDEGATAPTTSLSIRPRGGGAMAALRHRF